MNRYRAALAAIALAAVAAVLVSVLRQPTAPGSGGTTGDLLPVSQRQSAPAFTGIEGWINSAPLTVAGLRGKVILVDFWTFSCVNCVRTVPHLRQLYDAYRGHGFLIVGVHSPEFDFEKVPGNVRAAVQRLDVTWPVALDSEMATWNAYSNQFWPAEYLIDQQGRIAYVHFGEGEYEATDSAVAMLLGIARASGATATPVPSDITPELYAGSDRGQLADGESYGVLGQPTQYPDTGSPHAQDQIQVVGSWTNLGQYLQADSAGHVRLNFHAGDVFVVVGTSAAPVSVAVSVDGGAVPAPFRGSALTGSGFSVSREDLFHVLTGVSRGYHLIDLSVPAGFRLYTFTFG